MLNLAVAIAITFFINIPFGYWRASVKKFSTKWFLAVHLPIPVVIATRFLCSLGFELYTYPFLVSAFFLGQWLGGLFFRQRTKRHHQLN